MTIINQKTCTQCGLCAEICVQGLFEKTGAGIRVVKPDAACVACGHCMAVCPTEAVTAAGLDYADFGPLPEDSVVPAALSTFLAARRSVRRYRPGPVPREMLERVIAMAAQAPVGIPPSSIEVTIITDPETLARFAPISIKQIRDLGKALRTPVLGFLIRRALGRDMAAIMEHVFVPLIDTADRALREDGRDMITWNAPAVLVFHAPSAGLSNQEDALIAMTQAMLAAESLGLGTCVNGVIQHLLHRDRALRRQVGLPDVCRVYGALLVGHPAGKSFRRTIPRSFARVTWR